MAQAQSQIRALASAVARVFAAADLTYEQRNPERIEHTRLAWMAPALMPTALLGDEDLSVYLDYPLKLDVPALHRFWQQTMNDLWHKPDLTMRDGLYAGLHRVMPSAKVGMRALRFSQPPGYPGQLELLSGIQLSLEVAHAAYLSAPCKVRLTLDDYVVTTADGLEFGVRGGQPIIDSPWTGQHDASGEVLEMMEQPRGAVTHACQYDQIAMVRSVLHTHPAVFGDAFDGLDSALQALRYLSWGSSCPNLVTAMQLEPSNVPLWRHKERAVREALATMASDNLNDRQKLQSLWASLVPEVISKTAFRKHVFSTQAFPFTMLPGRADMIVQWLRTFYETEIPCNLRRSL